MSDSLTMTLAQYATSTSLDKIPAEVRERAKQVILDEMAGACFARRSTAGELAARYAAKFGGAPESTILGTSLRAPAQYAAMANGTAGHGEEVDGAHVAGGHPAATIVHAAVAMAEAQRVPGAELLNAVVLGFDVGVRLVEACGGLFVVKNRFHLHSDFMYAFGGAVAACRIMGLDPMRHCHAMALVSFQANGTCALFNEKRHISKSFCNGQYAFAGVSSAQMSAIGLEGCEDILGEPHGLFEAWGTGGGREAVTRGLGQDYAIMRANFKFINAGYPIHAAVEAAMTLQARHAIKADAIASVHVGMPENTMRVVDNRRMHNICVQDMVTAALVQGGLSLRVLPFPTILSNAIYTRLRAQATLGVDPGLQREQPDGRGATVSITTTDGSKFSNRVDHPRGHCLRGGVTWSELSEKWRDGLPQHDVERMLALAQGLDEIEDVNELADAFTLPR